MSPASTAGSSVPAITDKLSDLPQSRFNGWGAAALTIAVFAALSTFAAATSTGFLEADSCTHYLYARFALSEPHYLVNVWGRPICTALYMIPAAVGGRMGVRTCSLFLAVAIGLIAMRSASRQRYRWPVLALIFTLAQPLVFLHSFSELTELPFALLLAVGFLAYQDRQFLLMAAVIGLMPLSRPEGFGFIGLAAFALLVHRKPWWLPVLFAPLLLWDYWGWHVYGKPGHWWMWLHDNWPYESKSLYDRGSLLHFVMTLPAVTSPFVFPATLAGIWWCLSGKCRAQSAKCRMNADEERTAASAPRSLFRTLRCALCTSPNDTLIAVIPLLILVGHSLLYWLGKMASNGELRYMLVVAPFWGLLSARGWEWVFSRRRWKFPVAWAMFVALLPGIFNSFYKVLPLTLSDDWLRAGQAADWYRQSGVDREYPFLLVAHPGICYFLDISATERSLTREWWKQSIQHPQPGTLIIWDPIYGVFNADAKRSVKADEIISAGWILDEPATARLYAHSEPAKGATWLIFRSPRDIHLRATPVTSKVIPSLATTMPVNVLASQ